MTLIAVAAWGMAFASRAEVASPTPPSGIHYTNILVAEVPWSIQVVKVGRADSRYDIRSRHAGHSALGLAKLTDQIADTDPSLGTPVAAVNGGFYRRDGTYAGSPRGLQIVESEVLSAPSGNVSFWVDLLGEVHGARVSSRFQITWPDGRVTPFGLNGERPNDGVELYTPAAGTSTHTQGGRELVLERGGGRRWLPLRMGRTYSALVREAARGGDTPLSPDTMVLSLGPSIADRFAAVGAGAVLGISTDSSPALAGARTALSGGPLLVHEGRPQKIRSSPDDPYEFSSMLERHPRTAFGWNRQWYFLVQVDGRQRDLSVGMTLEELAACLAKLGCEEAINLDGGGSSSLWYDGKVRNNPCDGYERTIANALVAVRKEPRPAEKISAARIPASPRERNQGDGN